MNEDQVGRGTVSASRRRVEMGAKDSIADNTDGTYELHSEVHQSMPILIREIRVIRG